MLFYFNVDYWFTNSFHVVFNYYLDDGYELFDDKIYFSNINESNEFNYVSSFIHK